MNTPITKTPTPEPIADAGPNCAESTGSAPWIAVEHRKPKTGRKVIVCGHWPSGARWITTAKWYPAGTLDASDWDDPPEDWWDEDQEKCANPTDEWMEETIEGETSWALSTVTHWMPLPALPNK